MLGTKFYKPLDSFKEYSKAADWCNSHKATIVDKGDYYEVVEAPTNIFIPSYDALVVQYIRERYDENEEYSILRKKLANIDKGEFNEYNSYCEDCKVRARELIESLEG